jgi:hypothetical protein
MGVLTGLYLAVSPWIMGFNGGGLSRLVMTNLIVGIGCALLMSAASAVPMTGRGAGVGGAYWPCGERT